MAAQTTRVDVAGIDRPRGALDLAAALAPYRYPLNERSAAHLLRRAGFGGTPEEIRRYAAMSVNDAVESLVRFAPYDGSVPSNVYDPFPIFAQYGPKGLRDLSADQRNALEKEIRQNENRSLNAIRIWWLDRMLAGPSPLQEKMTLAYHGHFTTVAIQKGITPKMILDQNQLFRAFALGNVRELTRRVSSDAAMLVFLDGATNVAAHPNENYARELMELFTLGVDHYSEQDVRESARAWTGWRFSRFTPAPYFEPRLHDGGTKTFLGQTGNFNGDDIVNIIFAQPQCARFFANFLINTFVYNDPEPELIDAVAALIRKHDYEMAPVVSAILRSNVFFSPRAYRALVKSPTEFVVSAYKALGVTQVDEHVPRLMQEMGQLLFYPPNVAGWPGGKNWLTSGTMIARQNFLTGAVNSQNVSQSSWLGSLPMTPQGAARGLVDGILQGDASPSSLAQLHAFLDGADSSALGMLSAENFAERVSGAAYLAMASPAFQLN